MIKGNMYSVNFLLCPSYAEGRQVHSDSCLCISPSSSLICGIKWLQVRVDLAYSAVAKLQELVQQLEHLKICRALTITAIPHLYFWYFRAFKLFPGGHICCIYGLILPLWRRHYLIFLNRNYYGKAWKPPGSCQELQGSLTASNAKIHGLKERGLAQKWMALGSPDL